MARPRKKVDLDVLRKLAMIHCTLDEIASVVGCSRDTLERRFAATIKEGKDIGKSSLRRLQWEAAQKGNTAMLIWLGKQMLGQKDSVDVAGDLQTAFSLNYSLKPKDESK